MYINLKSFKGLMFEKTETSIRKYLKEFFIKYNIHYV